MVRQVVAGEDENSADRFDVLCNIFYNNLLMDLVLLDVVSAGQPRRVVDANLGRRLSFSPR
jgi:hypothetical protein